jgi:oligopeptide transport system substrate-binding protein
MWRSALNVETEIIQKDWNEYELAVRSGDYDVARRSYVMQTADESSSLREMLEPDATPAVATAQSAEQAAVITEKNGKESADEDKKGSEKQANASVAATQPTLSEAQAVKELHAMPIYFASSYALVKPYVVGFETNLLDAPSLKRVRIDTSWQQPKQAAMIWFKAGE